jgi:arsenical pump membrane protein
MIIFHLILALIAVGLLVLRPRSAPAACVLAVLAAVDVALGGSAGPVVSVVAPLVAFLAAALTLARVVDRSGLAARTADLLAVAADGNTLLLYALVCLLCGALTAAVSLDAAVVLMVPLLLSLATRFGAPLRPLFLGVVAVANVVSIAVPQGNPTNLVLINRLGLSPIAFTAHMLVPGLVAGALSAIGVALCERRTLTVDYKLSKPQQTPLSRPELHAVRSLAGAGVAAWVAPLFGIAPWWPFTGAVLLALAADRRRPQVIVPWRIAIQIGATLIVVSALGLKPPSIPLGLLGLLITAAGLAVAAAILNNLPASVWAGSLLNAGTGYAAAIGLAIGPLATPHGSVATLIATDLAGDAAPAIPRLRFALITSIALAAATLLVWAGL